MPTVAERYRFGDVENDGKNFIIDMQKLCKVHNAADVEQVVLMRTCNKDVLARHLASAMVLIERQHEFVINQRVHISHHQKDIVQLQGDLIEAQKKSIEKFQNEVTRFKKELSETVQDTVESSVKKSYSTAVQSQAVNTSVICQETLKSVAKQVVVEEEISRNVMVFGLAEDETEDLNQKIGEVFEQLEEKPRFEATRLGKNKSGTEAVRPVKVALTSATIVQQILSKCRKLRLSARHKAVFLSPDRTAEERVKQRELVVELKRRSAEEPLKRHLIKGGQVVSTERPLA